MSRDRIGLVLDDPEMHLGEVSLRLLRLGIDVVYAKHLDEATLLAHQEGDRIRAILFPPSLEPARVAALAASLSPKRADDPVALLVIGAEPEPERLAALREAGVAHALWDDFDDSALRFVANCAVYGGWSGPARACRRIPTTLRGRIFMGTRRKDVLVSCISSGGAYLETPHPLEPGTELRVEIELPDGAFLARAAVRYAPDPAARTGLPSGMGVVFEGFDGPDSERLADYVVERSLRYEP